MAVYDASERTGDINWAPATEREEVLQNVGTILGTPAGTVPMARSLGIDGAVVDGPMTMAKTRLMVSVYRGIQRDEPRATVLEVYVDSVDADTGQISPTVKIDI